RKLHFGATTTQRVEGAHSAIKHAIETSIDSNDLIEDISSIEFENSSLKSRLYKIETQYVNFLDKQQKLILLKKLDDILAVPKTKLSEIKILEKITRRGCPSGTKRLLIAIEKMDAVKKKKENQIYNPKYDGNCGFRALAIAIRRNEENWVFVKLAINGQLNKLIEIYKDWLGYNIDSLKWILESRVSPCSSSLWFLSPDCAQLAADTFLVPIAIFDEKNEQCSMFFPLESAPIHRRNLIILHFVNSNHVIYVGMKSYTKAIRLGVSGSTRENAQEDEEIRHWDRTLDNYI
ncbi:29890_t:CDS:2, partial [Gigaspora margarita]